MHRVQHTRTESPCEYSKGWHKTEPLLEHRTTQQRQASRIPRENQAHRWAWLDEVFWVIGKRNAGDETKNDRSMWSGITRCLVSGTGVPGTQFTSETTSCLSYVADASQHGGNIPAQRVMLCCTRHEIVYCATREKNLFCECEV